MDSQLWRKVQKYQGQRYQGQKYQGQKYQGLWRKVQKYQGLKAEYCSRPQPKEN